ncbi:hypothetical protein ZWY2020_019304 [Hordeum vulgare]|nr:hypothetical protein ZWY2020_019304 [Hordeum vulgare]
MSAEIDTPLERKKGGKRCLEGKRDCNLQHHVHRIQLAASVADSSSEPSEISYFRFINVLYSNACSNLSLCNLTSPFINCPFQRCFFHHPSVLHLWGSIRWYLHLSFPIPKSLP